MQKLAEDITAIIKDYHNYRDFQFTPGRVLDWVNQFEKNDCKFILEEFLYMLNQGIYFNEKRGRRLLINRVEELSKEFGFSKTVKFLANADFLDLQNEGKSQHFLLNILDEELQNKYGISLAHCGTNSKKYAIYIDDILATGGTVFKDCLSWLKMKNKDGETNLEKVVSNKIIMALCFYCRHNWPNIPWRLKLELKNEAISKKVRFFCDYEIQNHPKFDKQRLNFAYPIREQPDSVMDYFNSIDATNKSEDAFRNMNLPTQETLFSSPKNRIRFENIILSKGVELLQMAHELKPNHRPLGAGFPSYKTLGTGTLFFTWRNISNTCPIVFWWDAGVWQPLFPLKGRGVGNTTNGT